MKKKLLIGFLVITMCFVLTGCGNNDKGNTNSDTSNNPKESNQTAEDNTNNSSTNDSELKLYSDDTKLVFELGNIKYVFYYTGDTVTAYHTYIDYGDNNTATLTNQVLTTQDLENVDKHYVNGKYIVFEYNKTEYEDLKVSELRAAYSYMKEVTK